MKTTPPMLAAAIAAMIVGVNAARSQDVVSVPKAPCSTIDTPPEPLPGTLDHIEWWSDADLVDEKLDIYQITRIIVNRDRIPRSATWEQARLDVESLDPGYWVRYCPPPAAGQQKVKAPIQVFGNAMRSDAFTYVYPEEKPDMLHLERGEPLDIQTSVASAHVGNHGRAPLNVRISSRLRYVPATKSRPGHYVLSYVVENLGSEPVYVDTGTLPPDIQAKLGGQLSPLTLKAYAEVETDTLPQFRVLRVGIGRTAAMKSITIGTGLLVPPEPSRR